VHGERKLEKGNARMLRGAARAPREALLRRGWAVWANYRIQSIVDPGLFLERALYGIA
jgi:hypothetical protein